MTRHDIDKIFIDKVMANPEVYLPDLQKAYGQVKNSKAIYKGKPIPFLYMPKFWMAQDLETFEGLVKDMMAICHKMIDLYRSSPMIREKYNFDARLEALILKTSPYQSMVPMARFDVFYQNPGQFMFCELNTDGTSAMNEDAELAQILGETAIMNQMGQTYDMHSFELFDTWVTEVGHIYAEAGGTKVYPRVAIVDFFDKASSIEFDVFKERFEGAGYPCVIADARELTYDNGLYYQGELIDIVYRRLVTKDMMERIDLIPALEKACLDDQTLVIGNIQSQVVHTKLFFSLLFDQEVREFFNQEELAFIDAHVPHTEVIGAAADRIDQIVAQKDQYLIKPLDFYASIGVYAGKDYDEASWRELLLSHLDQHYLLQRFCEPPITYNVDIEEGQLTLGQYKNITGLYVYNTKLYGIYSRAGRTAIISGLHDVFTLPSIFVNDGPAT